MYWVRSEGRKGRRSPKNRALRCALAAFALSLGAAEALGQIECAERQKVTAFDAAEQDLFGISVSVSGDTAVVGALRSDCTNEFNNDCGAAYIYRFNGTSWVEEAKLTNPGPGMDDHFGVSVSVSGDTIVVGSDQDNCIAGNNCGAAFVYRFNGTSWVRERLR